MGYETISKVPVSTAAILPTSNPHALKSSPIDLVAMEKSKRTQFVSQVYIKLL